MPGLLQDVLRHDIPDPGFVRKALPRFIKEYAAPRPQGFLDRNITLHAYGRTDLELIEVEERSARRPRDHEPVPRRVPETDRRDAFECRV